MISLAPVALVLFSGSIVLATGKQPNGGALRFHRTYNRPTIPAVRGQGRTVVLIDEATHRTLSKAYAGMVIEQGHVFARKASTEAYAYTKCFRLLSAKTGKELSSGYDRMYADHLGRVIGLRNKIRYVLNPETGARTARLDLTSQ